MRAPRGVAALLTITTVALGLSALATADVGQVPGTAGATTLTGISEAPRPAFYEPPATIPTTPGAIIRSEPASYALDPLGLSATVATATKVMYASQDRLGRPIAVTGIVIVPKAPWFGLTTRPLISYAPGTQGMADRCAPTRKMTENAEYEVLGFGPLVTAGYAVAMTDYQGLGTPGTHTYMTRVTQARNVLDMARAAQRLSGTGLTSRSPVGLMGYSQGGGAAAGAVELQPSYAPDLQLKAALVGAVPADLGAVGTFLDGKLDAAFLGYAMLGLDTAYGVDPARDLNANGMAYAKRLEDSCAEQLTDFAFTKSSTMTKDGRPISTKFASEPWKSMLADNLIGTIKPSVPVMVDHSLLDDVIPYDVGKALAKSWCAKGANVVFSTNLTPAHLGAQTTHSALAVPYFSARFNGLPQWSNCWIL